MFIATSFHLVGLESIENLLVDLDQALAARPKDLHIGTSTAIVPVREQHELRLRRQKLESTASGRLNIER